MVMSVTVNAACFRGTGRFSAQVRRAVRHKTATTVPLPAIPLKSQDLTEAQNLLFRNASPVNQNYSSGSL